MANVILKNINKWYDNDYKAVNTINLDIENGEFVVLVGPSGCGKSTTLRMIAGLEDISSGDLYIGEKLVNKVESVNRDIAMVFQNYALYPHFSVYENMAFALKIKKMDKKEIDKKIQETAEILELKDLLNRKPKELSGGQRQRVALGRAIVREPKVFLMDEPLSNLDAKLRVSMRSEIIKLHQRLKTTFIYVTHDQTEAMTMGSKIVVMNKGEIQQVADPVSIYEKPRNKFVASFIGSPQMNFFNVVVDRIDDRLYIENKFIRYEIKENHLRKIFEEKYYRAEVIVGIRPEDIEVVQHIRSDSNERFVIEDIGSNIKVKEFVEKTVSSKLEKNNISLAQIELVEILGSETYIHFNINNNKFICKINGVFRGEQGQTISVKFNFSKAHFFNKDYEERIDWEE
ncbi:sn-glycerol-3-phosphate ABC transporter ATP-binding protein UgpC [Clostridium chromiireducens]|uniref:sn-glycerol-3-phosphate ABC transporter ATP-binding protein UgpC n=1 Tax=Clostridium chromiireducens TaxID=225345 RepID=A0A399IK53_9CLOT|nr:sn-glycerol-3-phosphate ABC transporter ATP-binding protein UgpC [Clostridium chromiireducens]RII33365.1 sn-glycerol-3-phosphate ABC transporter ATP-binding protein UgpC [Clostridium chromiireducens]